MTIINLYKFLSNKICQVFSFIQFKRKIFFLNVQCINFWSNAKPNELWFYPVIIEYLEKLESKKIKINFYSVFGKKKFHWDRKQNIKIFFNGENLDYYVNYKDHCMDEVDLSIGYETDIISPKYACLPLWILYYFQIKTTFEEVKEVIEKLEFQKHNRKFLNKKFCSLVASHDRNGIRRRGIQQLSSIGEIDSGGAFENNTDILKRDFNNNKLDFIGNYKFNMAFENSNRKFYTTEKIFDSIFAGTIPIYWGSDFEPEKNVLNQSRILHFKDENLGQIKMLNFNDQSYKEFYMQDIFIPGAAEYIFSRIVEVRNKMDSLILNKLSLK
jgi:hypothetical protein